MIPAEDRNTKQNFWLQFKNTKTAAFVLLLVFLTSILSYQIDLHNADDMARYLMNGKMIFHGQWDVLYKNFYSFTLPTQPFVNHHWLFGPIVYPLHQIIGWDGLTIFKIMVFLAAFVILFLTSLKKADFWLVALFWVPTIFIMSERSALRPQMFSYLFLAIFLYILTEFEANPKSNKIYWLIPIQILWVNIHLFFPVGVALVGGFLFEKIILNSKNYKNNPAIKKLATVFGLLVLACLVNPNFMNGALYPLKIFNNYGLDVSEN